MIQLSLTQEESTELLKTLNLRLAAITHELSYIEPNRFGAIDYRYLLSKDKLKGEALLQKLNNAIQTYNQKDCGAVLSSCPAKVHVENNPEIDKHFKKFEDLI